MSKGFGILVIDAQEDFFNHPNLMPTRSEIIASMHALLDWARQNTIPIFHTHTVVAQDGSNAMPHWHTNSISTCRLGSVGVKPPPLLAPHLNEPVFTKQFFNAFDLPELNQAINLAGIHTLIVMGLYTHACIREAALGAYARGLKVIIPIDAVGSYDALHADSTLHWLDGRAAVCTSSKNLMRDWESTPLFANASSTWKHLNPCNVEEVLFEVIPQTSFQIEAIGRDVLNAQASWKKLSIQTRSAELKNWLRILKNKEKLWVDTLITDLGKPLNDANAEVQYGFNLLENICATLDDIESFANHDVRYHPLGLVTLITPWNNPFAIPISKIGPALGFGNVALWKPALPASHLSELLMDSLKEANLDHLIGLILGGAHTGKSLIESPFSTAISFTGSLVVGKKVASVTHRLGIPLQAELGGNNAAIILRDANLSEAAQDLAGAIFSFAGQRCTAIRRIIVESVIADEFSLLFKDAIDALNIGCPHDSKTQMGPIINSEQKAFLLNQIELEKSKGTKTLAIALTPQDLSENGNWMTPTIFINPSITSPIWTEELFGPVIAICQCQDLEEAIALHNGVEQGLLGVLYSAMPANQDYFMQQAQAGLLSLNKARPPFNVNGPFLGWKESGIGMPEHGRWNRDFYTKPQIIYKR
ncbi:aldehyde dehydrogenase family protein [Polynucleobacter sp. JS-JIR-II-b4]|uniref:aldehyde dehydrogenase family protein n=1 Tax=Polynucleobacter sp. JS-JIR-II-b4 TaxID=1758390 RepID=UPI001BFE18EC|nr:aldehyde dehydrogenase family protein [Polynucleobacter sp. JS-JIR-II-b4]QWE02867.1 aldehyde dehydrogenase family protein [Polynucleobacter sp. JS-JIR-II-b4]